VGFDDVQSEDREVRELISRLEEGDESALADLFSRWRERLRRTVRFRLDPRLFNRVDEDDVLQEAYLNASQRVGHWFEKRSVSFFVWLRSVVTQTMIDIHRRHLGALMRDARREVPIFGKNYPEAASTSLALHLVGTGTSPSRAAVRAEMVEQVECALESMDPIDREVLALRHFEELTNGEVAEVLGIQQKAASIRYIRALGRLRSILEGVPGFFDEE